MDRQSTQKPIIRELSRFSKKEIDHLFENARALYKNSSLTILAAPRQKEFGRILVIASAKTGSAPKRNLFKRRLKSIFYENKMFALPYDIAVIARNGALDISFDQLKKIVVDAVSKNNQ